MPLIQQNKRIVGLYTTTSKKKKFNLKLMDYFVIFSKPRKSQTTNSCSLFLNGYHNKGWTLARFWKKISLKINSEHFFLGMRVLNMLCSLHYQKSVKMVLARKIIKYAWSLWQSTSAPISLLSHSLAFTITQVKTEAVRKQKQNPPYISLKIHMQM